ncbi:MAG: ATP-binding protein [Polyangia bacterium]
MYLLLLVPSLTERLERGDAPDGPRMIVTDIIVTLGIAVALYVVRRQSRRLAADDLRRIEHERALAHADRLATVGQLAAGVAHELGSPLQVISGRAQMISTREIGPDETIESAQIIEAQTRRMSEIIRQLLDFARRRAPQTVRTDLATLARDVGRFLMPFAKKRSVMLEVEAGTPVEAAIDVGQMQQVVTNLVMNALQATPEGGRVTLRVATIGEAACLSVEDTGCGMSDEVQRRVFEPFFTTKDVGEGSGLGLSVTHGLVQQNRGSIEVVSSPGRGSTFSILVPRCS